MSNPCKYLTDSQVLYTRMLDIAIILVVCFCTFPNEAFLKLIMNFVIFFGILGLFTTLCFLKKKKKESKLVVRYSVLSIGILFIVITLALKSNYIYCKILGIHQTKVAIVETQDGNIGKDIEKKLRKNLAEESGFAFKITTVKNNEDDKKRAKKKNNIIVEAKILKWETNGGKCEIHITPSDESLKYIEGVYEENFPIPDTIVTEVRIAAVLLHVYHLSFEKTKLDKAIESLDFVYGYTDHLRYERKYVNSVSICIWYGKIYYSKYFSTNEIDKAKESRIQYYSRAAEYIDKLDESNTFPSQKLELYFWLAKLKKEKTFCDKFINCYNDITTVQGLKEGWKKKYEEIIELAEQL